MEELLKLFDAEIKDGAVSEDFFGFGFFGFEDCKALSFLASVGVFVRGFVVDRSQGGEIHSRIQGFSGSVFRWIF